MPFHCAPVWNNRIPTISIYCHQNFAVGLSLLILPTNASIASKNHQDDIVTISSKSYRSMDGSSGLRYFKLLSLSSTYLNSRGSRSCHNAWSVSLWMRIALAYFFPDKTWSPIFDSSTPLSVHRTTRHESAMCCPSIWRKLYTYAVHHMSVGT